MSPMPCCCGPRECQSHTFHFTGPELPPEWTVVSGNWSIVSGRLHVDDAGGILEYTGNDLIDPENPMSAGLIRLGTVNAAAAAGDAGVCVRLLFNFEDEGNYLYFEQLYRDPNAAGDTRSYFALGKRAGGVDQVLAIKDKGAGTLWRPYSKLYYGRWEYSGRRVPTLVVEADRIIGNMAFSYTPELAAEVDTLPTNSRLAIQVLPGAAVDFDSLTIWRRHGRSGIWPCAYPDFNCGWNYDITMGSPGGLDLGAPWTCRPDGTPENVEWEYHQGSMCDGAETPYAIAVANRGTWNHGPEISIEPYYASPATGTDYRFFFHYQDVENWEAVELASIAKELRLLRQVGGAEALVDTIDFSLGGYPHLSPTLNSICVADGRVRGNFGGAGYQFDNYEPAFESGLVGVGYGANVGAPLPNGFGYKPTIAHYNRACAGCPPPVADCIDEIRRLQLTVPVGSLYTRPRGEESCAECPDVGGVYLLEWGKLGAYWRSPAFTICGRTVYWQFNLDTTVPSRFRRVILMGEGWEWFPTAYGGSGCAGIFPITYQMPRQPLPGVFSPVFCVPDEATLVLEIAP